MIPGYKQTEVGVVPEDWEVAELSSVSSLVTGSTPPTSDKRNYGDQYLFVSPSDLGEHKWISTSEKRISARGRLFSRVVPKSAILFVCIGSTIGKTGIAAVDLSTNQQITCAIIGDKHCPDFIYYALDFIAPRISFFAGQQAVPIVNKTEFGKSLIESPPTRAEQEAIAEALSDADALIDSLDHLIAKKRHLKQGAMQELLIGKNRLPGFSEDWEVKTLGKIAEIVMGQSPSSSYYNTKGQGLPLIQGNADISNRKTIRRVFTIEVTKRGKCGDILMSVRAPVGQISRALFDVCLGRGVCAIRGSNDFLYHCLIAKEPSWAKLSKGSTFDSVNSADVKALQICLPTDVAEQTAIATILSDMDAEIATLEAKLAKYRQIKQGMMHNLLNGRIRLL